MMRFPSLPSNQLSLACLLGLTVAASSSLIACDKDKSPQPAQQAKQIQAPTLRLYALAGAAGAIEPCGCVKDMLGGVDHAAAFINQEKNAAPHSLVVGAGPMFFSDPVVDPEGKEQAGFKAEAMAASLRDVGLAAWAPGANDWAGGQDTFASLTAKSGAKALAANVLPEQGKLESNVIIERGGLKIGLVGISLPEMASGKSAVETKDAQATLKTSADKAQASGADVLVLLLAAQRGKALRLIEGEPRFQVAVIGKGFDQGDSNDPPFDPEIIGQTLVVQAPNHLQGVSVVDLYLREEGKSFQDGSGLDVVAKRSSLKGRITELEERIARWKKPGSKVKASDLKAREKQLGELKQQLGSLKVEKAPEKGNYFLYDLVEVREGQGQDKRVASRLVAYYKQVNDYNRKAYADLKPRETREGQASYVGVEICSNCHLEERAFWNTTRHSSAYETLSKDHKEFNLDCVSCHVTGYDKPGGSTVTHVENLKDVQCEVCHGPGSLHLENPSDKKAIQLSPPRGMCASSCHHDPHVEKTWSVDEAWPHILGKGHGG